jgi:hypothetical protein
MVKWMSSLVSIRKTQGELYCSRHFGSNMNLLTRDNFVSVMWVSSLLDFVYSILGMIQAFYLALGTDQSKLIRPHLVYVLLGLWNKQAFHLVLNIRGCWGSSPQGSSLWRRERESVLPIICRTPYCKKAKVSSLRTNTFISSVKLSVLK